MDMVSVLEVFLYLECIFCKPTNFTTFFIHYQVGRLYTILLHTRLQLILLLLYTNAISESILMKKNCEFVVFVHGELNFALHNLAICPPFVVGLGPFLFWVGLCNRDG